MSFKLDLTEDEKRAGIRQALQGLYAQRFDNQVSAVILEASGLKDDKGGDAELHRATAKKLSRAIKALQNAYAEYLEDPPEE